MKTLVLGLGNTILSDDGVGVHIANEIKKRCGKIEVLEASAAGFRVIDEIIGYDKLVLIDSIKTGKAKPGTLFRFTPDDFNKTLHHTSPHDISLFEAIEIMKKHKEKLPNEIIIYAIEIDDNFTFSEQCTPQVRKAIPQLTSTIISEQAFVCK